ncbi:MAG TPA: type II secretion system F family protein [Planctomycetota bacterium]|nr:type II secretion system F family protein [Planctomycetota bacterium]
MPTYMYEAVDSRGQRLRSEIEASSEEDAQNKVRSLGYLVTALKAKGAAKTRGKAASAAASSAKKKTATIGNSVRTKTLTGFTRQLSTLVSADLPILRSLRICEELAKPGVLKNNLIDMVEDVEGGMRLSESMSKHPKTFDKLYVSMVKAGEAGGVLDQILDRLSVFMEKSQKLKKQVISAMIYPTAVITVAATILFLIITMVVPQFIKMFEDLGTGLPAPTRILLAISDTLVGYFYVVPAVPIGLYLLYKVINASPAGKKAIDGLKLHIPLFGGIMRKSIISRFARTLGTLINSGVSLLEALTIVREATGNAVISDAIGKVHDSVREGDDIAGPLDQTKICDRMVVNMVAVGEETGELADMLIRVADTYDEDVDAMVSGLMSLIEPALIVGLGCSVAFIVISLFLPLIELMDKLGKK